MGRLGFNILRQKERKKDGEAASGSAQQNEKNESVELNEFIQVIEEKNSKIRTIRLLLIASLTLTIVLGAYIAFTKPRVLRKNSNDDAVVSEDVQLQNYKQALKEEYLAKIAAQEANLKHDVNGYKNKLETLETKVKKDEKDKSQIAKNYDLLKKQFAALQAKYEKLKNERTEVLDYNDEVQWESGEDLHETMRRLMNSWKLNDRED